MVETSQITITATSYRQGFFTRILIGWALYAAFSQILLDLKHGLQEKQISQVISILKIKAVSPKSLTNKGTIELTSTTPITTQLSLPFFSTLLFFSLNCIFIAVLPFFVSTSRLVRKF